MLTDQEIIASVTHAFLPLACEAQIWDFDSKLRFKILENGRHVIRTDEVALNCARDRELLDSVVRRVRERVQSKGYLLQYPLAA